MKMSLPPGLDQGFRVLGFDQGTPQPLGAEVLNARQGSVNEAVRQMAAMHMQGQVTFVIYSC